MDRTYTCNTELWGEKKDALWRPGKERDYTMTSSLFAIQKQKMQWCLYASYVMREHQNQPAWSWTVPHLLSSTCFTSPSDTYLQLGKTRALQSTKLAHLHQMFNSYIPPWMILWLLEMTSPLFPFHRGANSWHTHCSVCIGASSIFTLCKSV